MKKALHIIGNILTAVIFLFALCVMIFTIISVNTVNKENDGIFGFKPYIVLSDSMSEVFQVGDMAISRQTDPATLQEGDIITFRSIDPANYGQTVTHKIRQVTEYEGQRAFITYGTTTGADDLYPVPEANVLGEYVFHLPKMGYVFEFLRTPAGYVTIILIPFLLLLGIQAVKFFRLVRQYKQEQQADITTQQEQIAAERKRTQELMDELNRVKQQMSQMAGGKTASSDTASVTEDPFSASSGTSQPPRSEKAKPATPSEKSEQMQKNTTVQQTAHEVSAPIQQPQEEGSADGLTEAKQPLQPVQKTQTGVQPNTPEQEIQPSAQVGRTAKSTETDSQTDQTESLQQAISSQSQKMIEQIEKLKQQYDQENQQGDGR